jgi:hypothetical protein
MSAAAPIQPWEPLNIPVANPAELEAMVTAAEGMTEQAEWQVLNIRAARVRALAEEARKAVIEMTEYEARACLPDCQGEMAMTNLSYRAQRVAMLARQSRRQLAVYRRHRARLEAQNSNTVEGKSQP